jgi:sugar O-acyltransferase (sialic acid O-acetyltransferase NeuD family)
VIKKKLLIFPYSGTGIEALDCLGEEHECIGFISDDENIIGKSFFGVKVFGREKIYAEIDAFVLAVIGSPTSFLKRKMIIDGLNLENERFASVIHPKAIISKNANIGFNTLIMGGVVVTSNAKINNHICILPNSVIHHDSIIGDYTLIGANVTVAGNVTIGENCYLGAASSIINGATVGEKTLIGIGSNVIKNIEKSSRVVGNPAKNIG